jgi:hypothetical protein
MDALKLMIPYIPEQAPMQRMLVEMMQLLGFSARKVEHMWLLEITQEQMTEWVKRTGMPNWNTQYMPTPRTIFEIAKTSPTVASCVELWKGGQIAWEQALMMAVCCLAATKDDYQKQLQKMKEELVSPIIVPMCRDLQHQAEFLKSLQPPAP